MGIKVFSFSPASSVDGAPDVCKRARKRLNVARWKVSTLGTPPDQPGIFLFATLSVFIPNAVAFFANGE
ncbi:MAG: hypothetical protein DMG39_00920 [Acidobacteria bacterium]|nr:MAG: hypothetical protein DMG39_00920 [Acidobacteriota bacterium]